MLKKYLVHYLHYVYLFCQYQPFLIGITFEIISLYYFTNNSPTAGNSSLTAVFVLHLLLCNYFELASVILLRLTPLQENKKPKKSHRFIVGHDELRTSLFSLSLPIHLSIYLSLSVSLALQHQLGYFFIYLSYGYMDRGRQKHIDINIHVHN